MIQAGIIHTVIGAIVKAVAIRDPAWRWDPFRDGFATTAMAIDLALLFAFAFLSWRFTKFFANRQSVFGDASVGRAAPPPSAKEERVLAHDPAAARGARLRDYPEDWWFFAAFFAAVVLVALVAAIDRAFLHVGTSAFGGVIILATLACVLVTHEAFHYIMIPPAARSRSTLKLHLGIGGVVVVINGVLSRSRLLVVQLAPVLFLSLLPLLAAFAMAPSLMRSWLVMVASINGLLGGADVVSALLLRRQVPPDGVVLLDGEHVEWRTGERLMKEAARGGG